MTNGDAFLIADKSTTQPSDTNDVDDVPRVSHIFLLFSTETENRTEKSF